LLLLRAQKAGAIVRAVTTVFEPASERGQKGMDELHQQAVNLLSFQPLPKDIYDAQVAFNMIARYGQKAQAPLDSVEARVLRHYQKIAGTGAPNPSLMLVQAPIFHGHALALFLEVAKKEIAKETDPQDLALALAGDHIVVPGPEDDPASNVTAAGQGDILLSVKRDPSQPNGVWLWAAADNVRIAALTAVECAESMIATRPVGKIQ
jgi:aspartate-semialdehyde dehydrogenase